MDEKRNTRRNSVRSRRDTDEEFIDQKNLIISKNINNRTPSSVLLKNPEDAKLQVKNNVLNTHRISVTRAAEVHTEPKDTVDGQLKILDTIECGKDVLSVRYSSDGRVLACGLSDGQIRIHKCSNIQQFQTLATNDSKSPVTALRFPDVQKKILAAGYASGMVHLWHYLSLKITKSVNDGRQVLALDYSTDASMLFTGGSTAAINMYDCNTMQLVKTFKAGDKLDVMDGHKSRVFSICSHPSDSNVFISGGWDDTVQFWDVRQTRASRHIYGPHICGDAIDIDYQHNHILTASWRKDNVLQIWDYASGDKIKDIPPDHVHKAQMYCCQWLGKDSILCGGSDYNLCRVLDRGSLNTIGQMFDLQYAIYCVDNDRAPGRPKIAAGSGTRVFILRAEKKNMEVKH